MSPWKGVGNLLWFRLMDFGLANCHRLILGESVVLGVESSNGAKEFVMNKLLRLVAVATVAACLLGLMGESAFGQAKAKQKRDAKPGPGHGERQLRPARAERDGRLEG